MDIKGILVFAVLFFVMIIAASQIQSSFTNEVNENEGEILENREFLYETRDINNEFRNQTLDYLANLTEKINKLEQAVFTNQ